MSSAIAILLLSSQHQTSSILLPPYPLHPSHTNYQLAIGGTLSHPPQFLAKLRYCTTSKYSLTHSPTHLHTHPLTVRYCTTSKYSRKRAVFCLRHHVLRNIHFEIYTSSQHMSEANLLDWWIWLWANTCTVLFKLTTFTTSLYILFKKVSSYTCLRIADEFDLSESKAENFWCDPGIILLVSSE